MLEVNNDGGASLLQQIKKRQDEQLERLSSGSQLNSAADGAAARQIVNRLSSQIDGDNQAISNVFDGVSLNQVAEGGLQSVGEQANRIRELTLQAGNGILTDEQRTTIQTEIEQIQDGIRQTVEQTTFAGQSLLSEDRNISLQVGANAGQTVEFSTQDVVAEIDNLLNIDVTTQSVDDNLAAVDEAIQTIDTSRAQFGAAQNRLDGIARNLGQSAQNSAAARARISDTDFAQSTAELISANIRGQSATAIQAQANQQQGIVLSLLS